MAANKKGHQYKDLSAQIITRWSERVSEQRWLGNKGPFTHHIMSKWNRITIRILYFKCLWSESLAYAVSLRLFIFVGETPEYGICCSDLYLWFIYRLLSRYPMLPLCGVRAKEGLNLYQWYKSYLWICAREYKVGWYDLAAKSHRRKNKCASDISSADDPGKLSDCVSSKQNRRKTRNLVQLLAWSSVKTELRKPDPLPH